MRLPSYLLSLILVAATAANADSGVESQSLATLTGQANQLLGLGQFGDAARRYSEAIEQSPSDYVLYYKRATAYYSMNRFSNALEDFETVLRLTDGSFSRALLMKANILAREGDWAEAKKLTKQYTKKSGTTDKDVQDLLFSITEGEVATKKAQQAAKAKKYDECIEHSTNALTTASHAIWLRELRVECAIANGDLEQAIGDLTRLTHLTKPTADRFLRIANMSYFLLPAPNPQPIQTVKQCLHFDPDSKPCRVAHRSLKAIEKDFVKLEDFERTSAWASLIRFVVGPGGIESDEGFAARFDALLTSSTTPLNLPESVNPRYRSPRRLQIYGTVCKAYVKSNQVLKAEKWCEETLRIDDKNLDGLIARGEKKLKDEEWEDAVRAFEAAFEASGRSNQEIHQLLEKSRKLLKQSKAKDYYKVLDVPRSADEKTIKKAYRKAVMKAHPDKGGTEAKMAAVNEAYEVLSKPELRAQFDRGEDPNDPSSQQGGHPFPGGHPFQQMFFQHGSGPFGGHHGGGGQQFQFHFGG